MTKLPDVDFDNPRSGDDKGLEELSSIITGELYCDSIMGSPSLVTKTSLITSLMISTSLITSTSMKTSLMISSGTYLMT